VLQSQIVALDQPHELADLVGLGLTADGLKVDKLWDVRMDEDVMATADTAQLEAELLRQAAHIAEGLEMR
jgi:hypothetical protein